MLRCALPQAARPGARCRKAPMTIGARAHSRTAPGPHRHPGCGWVHPWQRGRGAVEALCYFKHLISWQPQIGALKAAYIMLGFSANQRLWASSLTRKTVQSSIISLLSMLMILCLSICLISICVCCAGHLLRIVNPICLERAIACRGTIV